MVDENYWQLATAKRHEKHYQGGDIKLKFAAQIAILPPQLIPLSLS